MTSRNSGPGDATRRAAESFGQATLARPTPAVMTIWQSDYQFQP